LILREFAVEGEGRSFVTKQIHYTGWPDHGIPSGHSMEDFELTLGIFIEFILNS